MRTLSQVHMSIRLCLNKLGLNCPVKVRPGQIGQQPPQRLLKQLEPQYALSIDRTGHRFAGPAMSMGATLIDADGTSLWTPLVSELLQKLSMAGTKQASPRRGLAGWR